MRRNLITTTLTALLLAGCGGKVLISTPPVPTPTPIPVTPSVFSALSGDWLALGTPVSPGIATAPVASFSGAITLSGVAITGVFRAFSSLLSDCPGPAAGIPFTGILDASNNLTLTAPFAGGVATITAALPQNLQTYISGTYQVVGGTCAMPSTSMKLAQFATATGTYTGTVHAVDPTTNMPIPGSDTILTAVLTQSTSAAADGQFPLTGTITSTGACTGKLAITEGMVLGGGVYSLPLILTTSPTGRFAGGLNPTATTMTANYYLLSGCGNQSYFGTLTRQ